MGHILTCVKLKLTVSATGFIDMQGCRDVQCGVKFSTVEGVLQVIGKVDSCCSGKSEQCMCMLKCHQTQHCMHGSFVTGCKNVRLFVGARQKAGEEAENEATFYQGVRLSLATVFSSA